MIAVDPSGPPPILGSTAYTGPPPIVVNQNLPTVDVQHPHAHPLNGPQGSPFLLKTPIPTSPGWYFQILLYSNLYLIPITRVSKYLIYLINIPTPSGAVPVPSYKLVSLSGQSKRGAIKR